MSTTTSHPTPRAEAPPSAIKRAWKRLQPEGDLPGRTEAPARSGLVGALECAALALIAFVPLLAIRPGVVTSDTKTYLYLDPGRFLSQVVSMWNPTVALGTVTHEYIGYLLPMGPFFYFFHVIGVPVWIAQRLWLGGILFAAGAGVLYLARTFSLGGPGRMVAALAFMLSPYLLEYAGRISVILLPWAGLPWLVALAALSLRRGGWRYPAIFALVTALVSGINATAVLYVGIAPALWLVYAVAAERTGTWRQAVAVALKIGLLTFVCCLWWIGGLAVEGAYGVNTLKYTETVEATSSTSNASEVIRGLGYWYFYGSDRLGPWTQSAVIYTQWIWLIALSYVVPVLAVISAVFVRWRHRAYFVLLVLVGLVLSVGAHPFTSPTPLGGLLKAFMTDTTAGLALRSTDRATPLVVLGLAVLLGTGVTAVWRRVPRVGLITAATVGALVIAANPAIFNGDAQVSSFFTQPASLPKTELAAINHLNKTHAGTRVFAIPGNDFASYRWGDTVDTPQAALLNRPFVTHEQQVMGSIATADTLNAVDEPIQEGIEIPSALAPMARLLSAGDVLVEYDQAYEHYGTPQPQLLALQLAKTPAGLSDPVHYGSPTPNIPVYSTLNEEDLSAPANPKWPSPLVSYTVNDPRPITRAESNSGALIVAGDATGLENLASTGMLNTKSAIYYEGTLDSRPKQLSQLLKNGADLVLTDTNRDEAFRWNSLVANYGYTQTPGENLTKSDLSDYPINLFSNAPNSKTVASYTGAVNVTASSYGNTISYTPENRAYSAIDDNLDTAWETGTFVSSPVGQWWQLSLGRKVSENHVTLVQPQTGDHNRWISRVTLTFDGGHSVTENLGLASRHASGQVVSFPSRSFRTLRITIDATTNDREAPPNAQGVGFAEVEVPGVRVNEVIKMPTDLLQHAGKASQSHRLTILMDRERVSPYPVRSDPETTISREFTLPTTRTFSLSGLASMSALIPDNEIDQLVGRPGSNGTGIVASSNGRLPGDLTAGAGSALDGNSSTAWQPGFGNYHQRGDWLQYNLPSSISFNHLDFQVIADGRHSVPTQVTISTQSGTRVVNLPPVADSRVAGATTTIPLNFPTLTGSQIRVTVSGVRFEYTQNFYSPNAIALPLGVAEVGIPNETMPADPTQLPGTCQSNLMSIDGKPVDLRIVGSTKQALNNGEMQVQLCGADAKGITLSAGTHVVETAPGHTPTTGWNLDQLVLDSAPGGGAQAPTSTGSIAAPKPGLTPHVSVTSQATTSESMKVQGATKPFELVLGQSVNAGWRAVASPGPGAPAGSHSVALGHSELLDSFANGWQVSAADLAALGSRGSHPVPFTVSITWPPQKEVWGALAVSGLGVAFCLLLAFVPRRTWGELRRRLRRSRRRDRRAASVPTDGRTRVPLDGNGSAAATPGPELAVPWARRGRRPPVWAILLIAVVTGAVAAAISAPLIGLAAALATGLALAVPQLRAVTAAVAVCLLVAAALSVIIGQALHPAPMNADWPDAYSSAGVMVWMAIIFLGADAVVEAGRRVAGRKR